VLLSTHKVEDSTGGQSRSWKWGNEILDDQEWLCTGIMRSVVPRGYLERIAASVERQKVRANDPAPEMVIDEIEIRAEVEFTKLDCVRPGEG
jgi:hypothetical protein